MNIVTGKTDTAHVTSADARAFQAGVVGLDNYVLGTGSKFAYNIDSANKITLSDGDLVINGCHARIPYGSSESLTIETGTVGYNRADLIVAEYTLSSGKEDVSLKVIRGTPSQGTAQTPSYVHGSILENDTTVDMPLFVVNISGVNLTSVAQLFAVIDPLKTLMERNENVKKIANSGVEKANAAQVTANSGVEKAEAAQKNANDRILKSAIKSFSFTMTGGGIGAIRLNIPDFTSKSIILDFVQDGRHLCQNQGWINCVLLETWQNDGCNVTVYFDSQYSSTANATVYFMNV